MCLFIQFNENDMNMMLMIYDRLDFDWGYIQQLMLGYTSIVGYIYVEYNYIEKFDYCLMYILLFN